jgi:HEAT repeat protein
MWNRENIITHYLVVLLVLLGSNRIGFPEEVNNKLLSVVHCQNQTASLEARWQWALEQIPNQPPTKQFWIGFSTERLMSVNSFIGRWSVDPNYPTFSELIYGIRQEMPEPSYPRYESSHRVVKEVAYLFEIDRASKNIGQIQTSNVSLTVYMKPGVLFWLGKVGYEQSLSLLRKLYNDTDDYYLKKRLIGHIGDLQHPQMISFLNDVLQHEEPERVRKQAVSELGQYHSRESLDILLRTVRLDSSDVVRREAVTSISRIELLAAENALIEIAKTGPSPGVRREAIDKLRDIDSPEVMNCLVSIINQDELVEIRRRALEALAQIENEKAPDMLIQIAVAHIDPRIREEAINKLRDFDEFRFTAFPKVIQCLESIINNQKELEKVQRTALDRLAEYETKEALNMLIQIAQAHANPRIRLEAIDKLRDKTPSDVIDCLNRIVNKQDELYKIQREALETLARIEDDKALDMLIQIIKTHSSPRIRREAVNQLRDIDELRLSALPKAVGCLTGVVNKEDEPEENQREAVEVLAQIEDSRALDVLVLIAGKHVNPRIREEAVDRLRDIDELRFGTSHKVIKCFESIINNQEELEEIQCRALDALKDIEHQDVRTYIEKTARSHPKPEIRRQAQEVVASWIRER